MNERSMEAYNTSNTRKVLWSQKVINERQFKEGRISMVIQALKDQSSNQLFMKIT